MQRAEKVTQDYESQYLALNGLLVKVSANVKKPDFSRSRFRRSRKTIALCSWVAKELMRRYQKASFR